MLLYMKKIGPFHQKGLNSSKHDQFKLDTTFYNVTC